MTITRLASAGMKHVARIAAASVALASVTALAAAGVAERASVADSLTVLGHLHWLWIPAALLLEFASMAAFAIMLRRLLLAAPGAGRLCAQVAWRLTPYMARARLARIARRRGCPLRPDEHVNWQVWGHAGHGRHPLWRTFLTEQRALLRELDELERAIASVRAPVLVLADPKDAVVPFETARRLTRALPDAHLQLVEGAGHHLPRRAPAVVADAIVAFLAAAQITDGPDSSASRDMNGWRVLSVLAGRDRRAAGPRALHSEEGETRWQTPVTTVRAACQSGRGEARRPRWAPASGSLPSARNPAGRAYHAGAAAVEPQHG